MKTQFDHILQSSFYLWFEYQLGVVGEAYRTIDINFVGGPEGPSVPGNDLTFSSNIPEGMAAYHSPYRQFLALEDVLPDTEFGTPPNPARFRKRLKINGADYFEYPDAINGKDQIIIDYNNGRVLLDKNTFGLNAQVKGNFNVKTFNSYLTSEDEESVLINSDFLLQNASLQTYLESKSKLGDKSYTIPAGFITTSKSRNDPFAFGGLDETVSTISVVIVANTNYELDFALSLFRDSAFSNFPVVPYERFPYGEYFGLKPTSRPYKYREFCETCNEKAYIKSVGSSKLSDKSNRKISKDLKVGFIDFDISSIRNPRAALAPPVVVSVGDLFESCVQPTPSKTPSASRTESPSNSATASVTYIPPAPWIDSFCLRGTGNVWSSPPQKALKNHLEGTYEIEQTNANLEKVITIMKQAIGEPGATQKHETWSRHGGIGENGGVSILYLESSTNPAVSGWYFILNNSQSQTTTPADLAFQSFQNEHAQVPWNVSWYLEEDGDWTEWHLTPGVACATPTSTSSNSVSQSPSSSAIFGDLFGYCATPTDTPFIAAPTPTPTKSPYPTSTWSATLPPGDEFDICKPDTPTSSTSISAPEIKDLCVNISQVTMEDQIRMLGTYAKDFPLYKLPIISQKDSPHIYGIGDNEFPNSEGAAFNGIFGAGVSNPSNGAWTAWKDSAPSVQGKTGIRIVWESIPISTFIAKYSIYRIDYSALSGTKGQYDPKDWKIEASDDGITWSVIQEKSGEVLQDGRNDYDIYTQKPYSHYRINVSDNNGGDYTSIAELEFYEPSPQREIQGIVGKLNRKRFEYAFHSNGLEFYKSIDRISSDTGEVDITASGAYSQLSSILEGNTPTFHNGYAYYANMGTGIVFAFADLYLYKAQKESTLITFVISPLGDQLVRIPFWSSDGQSYSADYWQNIPFHTYVAPRSSVDLGVCGTPSVSLSPPPASPTSTRTSSPTETSTTSTSLTPDPIATASKTECPQIDLDAGWCEQNYVMVNTGSGTGWGPGWSPNEASTFDPTKGVFSSLTIKWLGVNPYTGQDAGTNNTKFIGPETFVAVAESWDASHHNGLPGKSGQYGLYKSTSSCDHLVLFNSGNPGAKYRLLTQQCPVATTTVTVSPSFSATVTSTPSISANVSQASCEKTLLHIQHVSSDVSSVMNKANPSLTISGSDLDHKKPSSIFVSDPSGSGSFQTGKYSLFSGSAGSTGAYYTNDSDDNWYIDYNDSSNKWFLGYQGAVKATSNTSTLTGTWNDIEVSDEALFDEGALYFNGTSSNLTFSESATSFGSSEDFTIEFWSYREENMNPSEAIIGNHFSDPNAAQENRWRILYNWQGGDGWTFIYDRSEWVSSENTSLNVWHHIAITRKDNKISLYIDGALKGSKSGINKAMSAHHGGTDIVTIGKRLTGHGSNYSGFKGYMQDFRITKEAIYSDEFTPPSQLHVPCYPKTPTATATPVATPTVSPSATHPPPTPSHSVFVCPTNTVTCPGCDDIALLIHSDTTNESDLIIDSSTYEHSLLNPFVMYGSGANHETDQSQFGDSSIYFNGSAGIKIPHSHQTRSGDSSSLNLGTGPFTMEFWIRPSSLSIRFNIIDCWHRSGSHSRDWGIWFRNSDQTLQFSAIDGGGAYHQSAENALTLDTWSHVALVREADYTTSFYVDGSLSGSPTSVSKHLTSLREVHIGTIGYALYGFHWSSPYKAFNGYLDEIRISRRAVYTGNFTKPSAPFTNCIISPSSPTSTPTQTLAPTPTPTWTTDSNYPFGQVVAPPDLGGTASIRLVASTTGVFVGINDFGFTAADDLLGVYLDGVLSYQIAPTTGAYFKYFDVSVDVDINASNTKSVSFKYFDKSSSTIYDASSTDGIDLSAVKHGDAIGLAGLTQEAKFKLST
jgi:hypothetical protein|tara:strand:+ start:4068 stop:9701 length:5634 start_codon:yes stop_codon:yes gene_type:complete